MTNKDNMIIYGTLGILALIIGVIALQIKSFYNEVAIAVVMTFGVICLVGFCISASKIKTRKETRQ